MSNQDDELIGWYEFVIVDWPDWLLCLQENVISIEYIERAPAPEPDRSLEHPDWVSAVHTFDEYILTGAYDNSVRVWNARDGQLILSHAAHSSPVKAVCWITSTSFLTASHDQTVALWTVDDGSKTISPKAFFRGHANSVDGLCLSPDKQKVAIIFSVVLLFMKYTMSYFRHCYF